MPSYPYCTAKHTSRHADLTCIIAPRSPGNGRASWHLRDHGLTHAQVCGLFALKRRRAESCLILAHEPTLV